MTDLRLLRRLLSRVPRPRPATLVVFLMAGIAACSGQSCSCIAPIPGGFPASQERLSGIQTRFSSSFMNYVSQNATTIVPNLLPAGSTFNIPPSCTGSTKICCATPQPVCQIQVTPTGLQLTPAAPNNLHFVANIEVKTLENIPVNSSIGTCIASFDTTRSGDPYLVATGDVTFGIDGSTLLTTLTLNNPSIDDVDTGDLHINEDGSATLCAVAALGVVKGFIINSIKSKVEDAVASVVKGQFCQACNTVADCPAAATSCTSNKCIGVDGATCIQQLGVQGRADVGSFLQKFSPSARAHIDVIEAAGGYATADTGLSLGILGGSLADPHSACVPIVAPPTPTDVGPSASFTGDVVPGTSTPFHFGVGIHVSHLTQLGFSFWDAGGLCLGVGGATVSQLSAKTLALVMPSLNDLLHTDDAPALLQLRPQNPPTFRLGKGTFKTDANGTRVIDDPLLTVTAPGLAADFYLFVDDRYVRIATLSTDLALPMSLDTDDSGGLTFIAGDLSKAFANVHVSNTDLIAEPRAQLEAAFPTLLSVSIGALLGKVPALHLPTLAGLALAPKVITSVEPDADGAGQFLAIYADVRQATAARLGTQTMAQLLEVKTPPTSSFAIDHRDGRIPSVTLEVHGKASGRPFEWSYAFDGGTWHPYQQVETVTVTDESLWLQGKHTVRVRGRAVGDPASLDTSPVVLPFIIDSQPPIGSFTVDGGLLVAHATDGISAVDALEFRVNGGAFGKSAQLGPAPSAPGGLVVEVRDEAGNVAPLPYVAPAQAAVGCSIAPRAGSAGPIALLLAAAALLARRRTRLVAALLGLGACHHGGGSGSHPLDPTDQIGRTHDLRMSGTQLHISAYDQNYGDLAYTHTDTQKLGVPLEWTLVDGVDETADKDPKQKFRGGRSEPGPDVGYYSSLALTSTGKPHIAYWDATNHALKFANGPSFTSHTVDMGSADGAIEVGLFPATVMDPSDHVVVLYAAVGLGDATSGFSSELRIARATVENPASAGDWSLSVVETVAIGCAGRCQSGQACTVNAMVNGTPNTDPVHSSCVPVDIAPCTPVCSTGAVCIAGVCTTPLAAPSSGALPEGTGLFTKLVRGPSGQIAAAYYDHAGHRLRVATQNNAGLFLPQTIDGDAGTDYGQHVTAAFGSDGTLHLAYVDALANKLVYRSLEPGGAVSQRATIDDGLRAGGYHPVGASASLLADGDALSVLYQDQATSDLVTGTGLPWSHSDFQTGALGYGFSSHQVAGTAGRFFSSYVVDRSEKPLGHILLGTLP